MDNVTVSRRTFIVSASAFVGGMSLTLLPAAVKAGLIDREPWGAMDREAWGALDGIEFSPWIAILPDDTVVVRVATPEIGNGVVTQMAMNVTEELACDWSNIRTEYASVRRDYLTDGVYSKGTGDQPFFGGRSTDRARMTCALQVGASARERLRAAAAHHWNVPVEEVQVHNSVLTHRSTGRKLRYGQVAARAATITLSAEPALKPHSEWTFLGKASPSKLHLPGVVKGRLIYGMDVRLPGMVYAALRQSPVHGGRLIHHDPSAVLKMPGVRAVVVIEPSDPKKAPPAGYKLFYGLANTVAQSAVAVIADHYWQAKIALDALPMKWEAGPGAAWKTTEQVYDAAFAVLDKPIAKVMKKAGDFDAVKTPLSVDVKYLTPYCENATMEPLNGTALVTADRAEVWHPSQQPQQGWWVTIDETGLPPDKVQFHQTYVGGGFGRRVACDDVRMVVAIAKLYPGVPVHVIWSREESTRQGRYRTLLATRFQAKLDAHGLPLGLRAHACLSAPILVPLGLLDSPYVIGGMIPNVEVGTSDLPMHLLTGAYRAPWYNSFIFMVESFIDECAVAAKIDPLEYRLRLLEKWHPTWSKCLRVVAEKASWNEPLPRGQGRGIAISAFPSAANPHGGSIVCAVATVEVSPEGVLHVSAIDFAFDCGRVANPDAVAAQLEGGVLFALNTTLNEEITIRDGAVVEGNFDLYPILRMGNIPPKINIHFDALSGEDRLGEIGEAPVGPIGPAVGNAIFQATGIRLRTTPFRKHDLRWS